MRSSGSAARPSGGRDIASTTAESGVSPGPGLDEAYPLVRRADEGDAAARAELERLYGDVPGWAIHLGGGDLARKIALDLLAQAFPTGAFRRDAVLARMAEIRRDLEGPSPSALERLLAERVALCWLDLHLAELEAVEGRSESPAVVEHRARMCDRAERRYLRAIKSLAAVRKLVPPAIQVNVAGQQVVFGGGS